MEYIRFEINKADKNKIENHLRECSELYNPPLESYVDIPKYAEKIVNFSDTFEAWHNDELVGLVACYLNDTEKKEGFITDVSIYKSYQGKGIAKYLLNNLVKIASSKGFHRLDLEVRKNNINAVKFYKKLGFSIDQGVDSEEFFRMILINH